MHYSRCLLIFCFCCKSFIAFEQNTFAFKAKVIHNKKGVMKHFSLLVNDVVAVTNDAGIFMIALNNDVTHVKVALQQSGYSLLYPTGGYVSVPRNLNDVPEIIVGSPQDNTYLNQYLAVYKEMKGNSTATASELITLGKKLDSLQQILLQLNYTETDLRSAKEMQDGRDKYYPEITQNLQEYIGRAFNFNASLKYVADFAFEKPQALQNLVSAVRDYNNIFNTLNRQRFNYEKFISDYWQSDTLSSHFHQLISYALDTVHQGKILTLQNNINQINQYFTGTRDKSLKEKIQQDITREMPLLEHLLKELDNRNNAFQKEFSN
jgi:hypothetical protein